MSLIDYRRTSWGYNIAISHHPSEPEGVLSGHVWHPMGVRVGDDLMWETDYGYATAEVTEVKPCLDPWDMYRVVVKVVRRETKEGEVLWDAVSG